MVLGLLQRALKGSSKQRTRVGPPGVMYTPERRYINDIPYVLPKDNEEDERLNLQHHFLKKIRGGNHDAALKDIHFFTDILDVGCGTGRWCTELANECPHARIIGIDKEVRRSSLPLPGNVQFVQGNILEGLPFPGNSFAYVHQRLLVGGIPANKWQYVVNELVRVTKPGGYVELVEATITLEPAGPETRRVQSWWASFEKVAGFDLSRIPFLDQYAYAAGLSNVQKKELLIPLHKDVPGGDGMGVDFQSVFRALKDPFRSTIKIDPGEFDRTIERLPKEWNKNKTTVTFFVVYGQKRETDRQYF